jgi:hypothetical protein
MRTLITFFVCALTTVGYAQVPLNQTPLKTFTSSDGLFRFNYSDVLIVACDSQNGAGSATSSSSKTSPDQPSGLSIPAPCTSQFCDGPGSEGTSLACFAYPKERFENKSSFVGATFYVSEIKSAKTKKLCMDGSPDWFVIKSRGVTTINHIVYQSFVIGDNWTSHGQSGPAYRTFHNGKCYELGFQTVMSRAEYDPGTVKEFTKKDQSEVEGRLRTPLNSFVFLK